MSAQRYRVALTGASGGLGKAMAIALAGRSERMFLLGRDGDELERLRRSLANVEAIVLAGDITDAEFVAEVHATVVEQGGVNLLINNAGLSEFAAFEQQSPLSMEQLLRVNLLAPMCLTQALLPALLRERAAQIVNIGSSFSYIGYPGFSSYCATKFGLRGFTEALSRELTGTSVRVRLFSPRAIKTSLNSSSVRLLNERMRIAEDDPADVAQQFIDFLGGNRAERQIGFPEKIYTKLNQLAPALITQGMRKQLPLIRAALPVSSSIPEGEPCSNK
ncbi:MAG TPA: SDR family oxidoreductase [Burkholderiales bacterium]|nr:SDR family oxidoreductase [Burkholderiales bacterium]